MRRQYFAWTYLVLSIVLTIYGGYSIIYNLSHKKDIPVLGLIFFIVGAVLLLIFLVLLLVSFIQKKLHKEEKAIEAQEPEPVKDEAKPEVKEEQSPKVKVTPKRDYEYAPRSKNVSSSFDGGSGYVKLVGYGPVLRINEQEILDMRSNTYYRIEGNLVKQLGSGPVFEISGNRIRLAFGGYLYEISGGNVSKTFGGYYASISGGYLQTLDLKEKYEIPSDLNLKQKLAVVALLFGSY